MGRETDEPVEWNVMGAMKGGGMSAYTQTPKFNAVLDSKISPRR